LRLLEVGAPADLILFDWQPGEAFIVRATLIAGSLTGPERQRRAETPVAGAPG
jgi:hypothetical protein